MKPAPLTATEETEVSRLIAIGRNPVWARQRVTEDRFRRRGAAPAAIEVASGTGCNPSVLSTDQRHQEDRSLHANTMERNDAKRHIAER